MSPQDQPLDPDVQVMAFRRAQLPSYLEDLRETEQKLQTALDQCDKAQANLIASVNKNDAAYQYLVEFFGGDLANPQVDEENPLTITAMVNFFEHLGTRHIARQFFAELARAKTEIEVLEDDIQVLKEAIEEAQ